MACSEKKVRWNQRQAIVSNCRRFKPIARACVVATFVSRIGVRQILTSSHSLMDQSCIAEEEKIRDVLAQHKFRFIDFHNVRTRRHENQVFAERHLTVDGFLSVSEAHDLTDHLEARLTDEMPNMDVTIHIEPKP